jgi:hypothetical protein
MTDGDYTVLLVYSTSHALRAEKVLARAGIDCKLIPVPRELSSDCGVCVRVGREERLRAEQVLEDAELEIEGVHNV